MNLPSKQFIIRGSIGLGIVLIILLVQTTWFRGLFHKKPLARIDDNRTISEVVDADSNGNGIPDWQERLWGLDPTVLYTNGVSNKELIEQKRMTLGIQTTTEESAPLTDLDRLARDLYSLSATLGTEIDSQTTESITARLSGSVDIKNLANKYKLADLRTVPTSPASLAQYNQALTATVQHINTDAPGIEIAITAIETGDYSDIPTLSQSVTAYATAAKALKKITVPNGVAAYHIDLINGLAGMAESFVYLQYIDSDNTKALSGITLYKNHNTMFLTAVSGIGEYLKKYGIL